MQDKSLHSPVSEPLVEVRLSEVLSALSYALDLTEGQPEGHSVRSAMIGMSLAQHLDLSAEQRSALFYALLLKDLGCSSNAAKVTYLFGTDDHQAKYRLKTVNWSSLVASAGYVFRNAEGRNWLDRIRRVISLAIQGESAARDLMRTRCERGADIARELGFPEETCRAILDLDEHWDGRGHPLGLKGEQISLLGRVLGFAQTVEVFFTAQGRDAAIGIVRKRRGSWFDPALCDLFSKKLASDAGFWERLASTDLIGDIGEFEPADRVRRVDQERLDQIARAFARVIDAKSPYTFKHSERVAEIVTRMAEEMRMPAEERRELTRAALLHDIGKLGVSNMILDKNGKLNEQEWEQMRAHTVYTFGILQRVKGFSHLADLASAHHERLDGTGYHRSLPGTTLSLAARMLAVADQYEALTAKRPYRAAMAPEKAIGLLAEEVGTGIDPVAFEALRATVEKP